MKILQAKSNNELIKIDEFFSKIWWELFNINLQNQVEKYKKCDIYFFENHWEIISAIIYVKYNEKNYIWRFATLNKYQNQGLWSQLLKFVINKYNWDFHLSADENKVEYYKKFWFIETWEKELVWNEYAIEMIRADNLIKQAKSLNEKRKCIQFYQNIWSDDLEKQVDIEYFLESDIFYIEVNKKIIACIEVFIKKNNHEYYKNRYDFAAIKKISKENFVYISRLATHKNFRNKWYAWKLLSYIIKIYEQQWIKNIYTTLEDYNFDFYKKFSFIQDSQHFQLKNYKCYNFRLDLSVDKK